MRDIDRFPTLGGKRHRVASPEAVLEFVRKTWPRACQEGSTGYERTWTCAVDGEARLVAHSWSPRADAAWYWVRVAATPDDTMNLDRLEMGSVNSRAREPGE